MNSPGRSSLIDRYAELRRATLRLCEGLDPEDYVPQSMPEASPVKWHLAHTSWFFERFVLRELEPEFRAFDPSYDFLFNSYYDSIGARVERGRRGLLTRPALREVLSYRAAVDLRMSELLQRRPAEGSRLGWLTELGLEHEAQHQELLVTDLKHLLWSNPLKPALSPTHWDGEPSPPARRASWIEHPEGLRWIGHRGSGFAFDHEEPEHSHYVAAFALASEPVPVGEYLEFVADGGYDDPRLWLSDGWAERERQDWRAPLYWERQDGGWTEYTLAGMRELDPAAPVRHVSYFEADAYARWKGARLATEQEWETGKPENQKVWEWTASPFLPYPGFRPWKGGLGEYNGKFMCNQLVLRGRSRATPEGYARPTCRNFFPPQARWQYSGIRLARDGGSR